MSSRIVSLTVVLALLGTAVLAQSDKDLGRKSLRGLPGVQVVVENISGQAERDGLSKSAIQSDVQARLRRAGIRVFSREEAIAASKAGAWLYVRVSTLLNSGIYSVCVEVSLEQNVLSLVGGDVITGATWTEVRFGSIPKTDLRSVRYDLAERVDSFVNDFLAANPVASR